MFDDLPSGDGELRSSANGALQIPRIGVRAADPLTRCQDQSSGRATPHSTRQIHSAMDFRSLDHMLDTDESLADQPFRPFYNFWAPKPVLVHQ
jgi:hypothetical protein